MNQNKKLILETLPIGNYACNCSILYSELTREAIIIDPGNDHHALLKKIEDLKINVKKLLHTHAHFDHIGSSNEMRKKTGATLHLHKDDLFLYEQLAIQGKFFGQSVDAPGPIDHFLNDGEEFSFEDKEIDVFLKTIHTPGHTPGSCCFITNYFSKPILFAGDTLFQNSIGRTDLPGGDSRKIIKSIKEKLFILPEETSVITGHGPMTTISHEKKYNPFLGN
jgi:glyoxylase-like metal-dependent hydrolase (beta-lactamase superfamily II)